MRRVLLTLVSGLLALGCGTESASVSTDTSASDPGASVRKTARTWYDARFSDGSDSIVVLTYLKPVGENCEESPVALVEPAGEDLRAEVRVNEPWAPETCDVAPAEIEVDLGGPLGDRRLITFGSGKAFVDRNGELQVDPASTPCGRADCSQPSPDPAPCSPEAASTAVASEIDGADPGGDVLGCDGSFLVVALTVGGVGCSPDQRQECARPQHAYFVARDGLWRLVTYGRDMACEDVYRFTAIRFSESTCHAG